MEGGKDKFSFGAFTKNLFKKKKPKYNDDDIEKDGDD